MGGAARLCGSPHNRPPHTSHVHPIPPRCTVPSMIRWKRALRTPSSERFVALRGQRAVATADLHYPTDGRVVGMVVLDEGAGWTEEQIPDLLATMADDLLPGVDATHGTLSLMVVIGEVVGQGEATATESVANAPRTTKPRVARTG